MPRVGDAGRMLVLATCGFTVCFWAWALISPLGSTYADELHLDGFQQALVVSVPVVVGSLGRIPVGALTDRFGARVMFPAVSALTILPVLFVGFAAHSLPALLGGGFFLGVGGTAFAVGVPFVNGWYPPERRGTALGVFGAGTIGTAISSFSTVQIASALGRGAPFLLVAAVLAVFAIVSWVMLRSPAPARPQPTGATPTRPAPAGRGVLATFRRPVTLQLALLYALGFGGFVAFSVYLPTYLVNSYGLTRGDAALRTAGFVVLAVVARPAGGWLSDRVGPARVLVVCFLGATVFAALAAFRLNLLPASTVAFLGLALVLGGASGAVFALVGTHVEAASVGAVTGVVGAAGGLGGFVPPLVMGLLYDATGHYLWGLLLLALASLLLALFTWRVFGRPPTAPPSSPSSPDDGTTTGMSTEGSTR
ncbi:MAG TPA: MFS transporter [Segeticoccus sp.]|uniref:MFS transporter n=1 Tax=Segeticoccus sp. TaxID=2706531 RepID=UPI002D7FC040|nr:MFS transporter [Segeticoccus sp.]HET8600163.1 MFS transporter [Segeticoccus sp.]